MNWPSSEETNKRQRRLVDLPCKERDRERKGKTEDRERGEPRSPRDPSFSCKSLPVDLRSRQIRVEFDYGDCNRRSRSLGNFNPLDSLDIELLRDLFLFFYRDLAIPTSSEP